jgi:Flp pilus assembly protein CpaB
MKVSIWKASIPASGGSKGGTMTKTVLIAALLFAATAALAADLSDIRLARDIVPAPFGYEMTAATYVVTEATPLYVSPLIYPGTVNNEKLMPGQTVNVLAKVKDYDWILAGKDGIGIGYIPLLRLAPANPNR